MDYDDDGILDMISGSYDPGDLYLFRGLGKGKYAARVTLKDEQGVPLVTHPKRLAAYLAMVEEGKDRMGDKAIQARIASFGSWPSMCDWDGDGDLDMLIGSFGGRMYLRLNTGTRSKPIWNAESQPVHAGGSPLNVKGKANPVAIDWDGDELWDLVVSAVDGSVVWYRNEGSAKQAKLGQAQQLVPPAGTRGDGPQPRLRSQLCVVDYDLDGKLDLLVGDFDTNQETKQRRSYVWLYRQR